MTPETNTPEQWVTGSDAPANTVGTIAAGQALSKYAPMGQNLTTGEFHEWDPAANDGTEVAVRIAPFAIDTTGGAADKNLIKAGTFNPDLVAWPGGTTAAQKLTAFVGTPISLQGLR